MSLSNLPCRQTGLIGQPRNKDKKHDGLYLIFTARHMSRTYYVYILASQRNGTLYIGVTNDLERRAYEHKTKFNKGFTEEYNVNRLVYFEETDDVAEAIRREKQLKGWNREWKLALIENSNPNWLDLAEDWFGGISGLSS